MMVPLPRPEKAALMWFYANRELKMKSRDRDEHIYISTGYARVSNPSILSIIYGVTDSLRSLHGVIYVIFYGRIPRISGNFGACADSVYQALLPPTKESLGSRLSACHDL